MFAVGYWWWCDEANNECFHISSRHRGVQSASLERERKQASNPGRSWRVADESELMQWKQQGKCPMHN